MNIQHPLAFVFGVLGNILSFMVFLAPLPIFYGIYKKKSTEEYQSLPYVVALLSAMLWMYYASLKSDAYLLIAVNSIGCILEILYTLTYMVYATKRQRVLTTKLLALLIFGFYSLIFFLSFFLLKGSNRVQFIGWVCDVISVAVFAAPMSTMRLVIRTKSVQFMPFTLSLFLTLSAVMWFFYGVLLKDLHVALPNIMGCILGVVQMGLYVMYKDSNNIKEEQDPHNMDDVVKQSTIECSEQTEMDAKPIHDEDNVGDDQNKPLDDLLEGREEYKIQIAIPTQVQLIECRV